MWLKSIWFILHNNTLCRTWLTAFIQTFSAGVINGNLASALVSDLIPVYERFTSQPQIKKQLHLIFKKDF
jgi:hypothetical protein